MERKIFYTNFVLSLIALICLVVILTLFDWIGPLGQFTGLFIGVYTVIYFLLHLRRKGNLDPYKGSFIIAWLNIIVIAGSGLWLTHLESSDPSGGVGAGFGILIAAGIFGLFILIISVFSLIILIKAFIKSKRPKIEM